MSPNSLCFLILFYLQKPVFMAVCLFCFWDRLILNSLWSWGWSWTLILCLLSVETACLTGYWGSNAGISCVSQGLYSLSCVPSTATAELCISPWNFGLGRPFLPLWSWQDWHFLFILVLAWMPLVSLKRQTKPVSFQVSIITSSSLSTIFQWNAVSSRLAPRGPACCYLSSIWNIAWHTVYAVQVFISGTNTSNTQEKQLKKERV